MQSRSNRLSVVSGVMAVIVTAGFLLIGTRSVAAGDRAFPGPSDVSLTASGIALTAQLDGTVLVTDRAGSAKLVLGNYRLTWTPGRTDGGVPSLIALPGGDKAIRIDYKVLDDPTNSVRIKGQFSFQAGHLHVRYDVWGPEDLKTGGAMLDCAAQPASSAIQVAKLGRWVRDAKGGVHYEVPDVNLIGFPLSGTVAYLADYGGKEQGKSSNTDYWNFLGSVEGANAILARYGHKELWITEAYASTVPNNAWTDTERHAAENLVLSYALAAANGVRVMDWYQLNDSVWYDQGGINPTDPEYHFGLLQRDLSPKPSLLAYATIAAALDQAHFVRRLKFENAHTHGLLFDTPRGPMSVLWDRTDGYLLNTKRDPVTKSFATPEPWIDDWKSRFPLNLRATGATVREIDCIGRQRDIAANHGVVAVTLDGAPRIFYGLATDP